MCGIFGFWQNPQTPYQGYTAALLQRATDMQTHRGPDSGGIVGWNMKGDFLSKEALIGDQPLSLGLGHRRLAIIDLTTAGHQPMQDIHNHNWLVFNGEIYNYRELRATLREAGYIFHTNSDTEVILKAYQEWGYACVHRFNGMWAFVLYDARAHILFMSRDRLGVKPFYLYQTDRLFVFSSEIKSLLACPGLHPKIDPERLISCMVEFKIDYSSDTLYSDIKELRGGHCLRLDLHRGSTQQWCYWTPPTETDLVLSDATALERYSELIEDAVRLRLHADVPVGITLSGGVDSSVIAAAASRVWGQGITTFTSHFPNKPEIDETNFAKEVAQCCHLRHIPVEPRLDTLLQDEERLHWHHELPFRSLSIYVHWALLQQIRNQGIVVVLSGQGGDELFLGYETYYISHALSQLPNPVKFLDALWQGSCHSKISFPKMLQSTLYFTSWRLRRQHLLRQARPVFQDSLLNQLAPSSAIATGNISLLQLREITQTCLPTLLRYDDRTASALAMETRLPFLDYRFVEFACRLPAKHKIRDGWTKYISRCYLEKHVSKNIAWRKNKLGFDAPQADWTAALTAVHGSSLMKTPFAKQLLRDKINLESIPKELQWRVLNIVRNADLFSWYLSE
ncbi:MAG: asparagine synthase (glutamine-hydrolyzing) [Magnetococcus sp. DMHC-6]